MPEQPEPKHLEFRAPTGSTAGRASPGIRYAELHCATNFSFLEGASHGEELAVQSAALGHAALAITDRNSLAGVVRAHVAAKEAGLKLIIGALVTPIDASPVLLWATDRAAYGRLSRLLTIGRRAAPKGECRLMFDNIAEHSAGLLAGVLLSYSLPPCGGGNQTHTGRENQTWLADIVKLSPIAATPWRNSAAGRRIGCGCGR